MRRLGHIFRTLREEQRMSRADLSEISGVSQRTIFEVENDVVNPRLDTLDMLAKALDVPLHEIIQKSWF